MDQLMIFTETNIYILSKLVALVRRNTGTRHRLNSNIAIIGLLKEASNTSDKRIQSYFLRFLENLTAEQLVNFKNEGLDIPEHYMRKPGIVSEVSSQQYVYSPL